jgi:hypothetical protein
MAGYISFEFDSHTTNYDLRKPYTRNTIILDTVFRRYGDVGEICPHYKTGGN